MDRIVIEVADATIKNWETVPANLKNQLQKNFESQIEVVAQGIRDAEFKSLLNKVGEEARKNGLTEEILQELLKDE